MMVEIWKDIKGYEGLYQVSTCGRIKSLARMVPFSNIHTSGYRQLKEKILKGGITKDGYNVVTLRKDNIGKIYSIHRLVAETFIPNPNNLPEVNHKDENKVNNHVDNLEWCTHQYNSTCGTIKSRQRQARLGVKHSEKSKKLMSKIKKEWWQTHKIISV